MLRLGLRACEETSIMADEQGPGGEEEIPQMAEEAECLRCRQRMPVDEDGFCAACAKAIEQACL
ncbi:MAG: hypothetical protein D4S02_02425 [Rhodocyclaceae bacterium]|nr:MAG: hypothetical protein D4S02_02425 [Rhodocyclaceae bacterium]